LIQQEETSQNYHHSRILSIDTHTHTHTHILGTSIKSKDSRL
jgi:hypothetical protein